MRAANQLVGATLAEVGKHINPGVTTLQLDRIAEEFIRDHGATPSFKGCPNPFGGPFPASICTSVNNVVVHGIPSESDVLEEGDIVSVDCGVMLNGYCGDSCYTFKVGDVSRDTALLLETTLESLRKAITVAVAGHRIGDIGAVINSCARERGYRVVEGLGGHGIGRKMHEDPFIPNNNRRGRGPVLKDGMCIAIEPMLVMGSSEIGLLPDQWGIVTFDGRLAAHFEHTIVVRRGQSEILSSFKDIVN